MIRAYSELYLMDAQRGLSWMLHFAVNDMGMDIDGYFDMFIRSGIADLYGTGDASYVAGKSGIEVVYAVLDRMGRPYDHSIEPTFPLDRTAEYWTGWALSYYQWFTGLSYREIVDILPVSSIRDMYHPYHEMDIRHFVLEINRLYMEKHPLTNLRYRRDRAGFSQKQLSVLSGVPLRTIQQYEQRQMNINRAQGEYLYMLARALYCNVGDLLERVPGATEEIEK